MAAPATPITVATILDQFREDARNKRDLGDRFERLMVRYFELDPIYADRFSDLWMWNEWPDKGKVGDVGIDLVARERATGEYCGIQCKFYLPEHTLSKEDLDSYFTTLGRDPFKCGIIVSTTDRWGKNALDALNRSKSVSRLSVHDLEPRNVDWSRLDAPAEALSRPLLGVTAPPEERFSSQLGLVDFDIHFDLLFKRLD